MTELTLGTYVMLLEVRDNSGNTATDLTEVRVTQDTNQPPVSDPGPNIKIVLPANQAVLDGRGSSDDLAVESWQWSRDGYGVGRGGGQSPLQEFLISTIFLTFAPLGIFQGSSGQGSKGPPPLGP